MHPDQVSMPALPIEIKVLRLGGKKLKRALFRQIPLRPIIGASGEIRGAPLGHVNYFPSGRVGSCVHIVWQAGGRLYRDLLYDPAVSVPESIANTMHLDVGNRPRRITSASLPRSSDEVRAALRKAKESYARIVANLEQLYIGV